MKFCYRLFRLDRLSLSLSLSLGSKPLSLRLQKLVELSLEPRLAYAQSEPIDIISLDTFPKLRVKNPESRISLPSQVESLNGSFL
jgi:hypothetical protein